MYPISIRNFIKLFSKLPGIGPKSSERIAFYLLSQPEDFTERLAESIRSIKRETKKCIVCGNIDVKSPCNICSDDKRDKTKICVVESPVDIYLIEEMGIYSGLYHSLDGLISPLAGVKPSDLTIDKLVKRINKDIKEIIFALSATLEGDTTLLYIKELIKDKNVKITVLARGIPVGTGLQYAGIKSIEEAFRSREEVTK